MLRFVPRIALVLLLVVAGSVAPAAAEDRPFNVSGAGIYDRNSGSMYGFGFEATHLGKARSYGYVDPNWLDNSQLLELFDDLTASNGDRLYMDCVMYYDVDTGIAIGTLTFIGGTGRFEPASGTADVMFDFGVDYYHPTVLFLIDGSIDY